MNSSIRRTIAALGLLTAAGVGAACSDNAATTCSIDDDCESKFCRADGTCGPVGVDAPPGTDSPPAVDGPVGCMPNGDDSIAANEYPVRPGGPGNLYPLPAAFPARLVLLFSRRRNPVASQYPEL